MAQRGADFIAWRWVRGGATVRRERNWGKNGFPGDLEPKLATERGDMGTIIFRIHPCVILHALGVRHPGIYVTCPGCNTPWDLPWVISGRFPWVTLWYSLIKVIRINP